MRGVGGASCGWRRAGAAGRERWTRGSDRVSRAEGEDGQGSRGCLPAFPRSASLLESVESRPLGSRRESLRPVRGSAGSWTAELRPSGEERRSEGFRRGCSASHRDNVLNGSPRKVPCQVRSAATMHGDYQHTQQSANALWWLDLVNLNLRRGRSSCGLGGNEWVGRPPTREGR